MRATSFPSPTPPDKTFKIAVIAVVVVGVVELLAVGVHYGRARAARKAAEQPATSVASQAPAAEPAPSVAAPSAANPVSTAAPGAPVVPQTVPSNAALSMAENLLKEATLLRERGDTTNALARLQDASQRDPKNPNVLAEMAMIYESIQLFDRSNETWKKIADMGPSVGPLYELATMKLQIGAAAPPAAAAAGPGFAGVSPLDAVATRSTPDGIPEGSTFGITEVTLNENPDPDAEANMTLRVAVKVRPNTLIDHTKVKIQVFFYDAVDNGSKYALTDAEVNYEWLTPDHDWKNTNPEVLAVHYVRLKGGTLSDAALAEAAANVTPPRQGKRGSPARKAAETGPRKYGGYQVRVYYNDQLQDVRAEPTKLLNLFAPPLTLESP
jgi:tetratricopeptide (TPR) repeat protein